MFCIYFHSCDTSHTTCCYSWKLQYGCVNNSPFALTGGSPSGGIYSGPGVSGGIFNPSTAGAGTHTITYTYTDANGCSAAASSAIIVNAIPPAAIFPSGSLSLCTGSTLTLAATPGYNYSWSTGATTSFIPVSSAGNYSVTVSDANGCSASSSPVSVTVNANQLIIPLFVETMGNPTANTAIGTWEANNGFDNISLTMSGSGEVRNTSVSSGYAGASGSGNVFLTNTAGRNFIISGINTNGLSNLQLQFGVFKSTTASNGSELQVLVSDNGGAYVQLPFTALPTGSGTTGWYLRTITSGIPASPNLSIQFLQTGTTPQFRIDDVMILYANPSPQISSSGSANICQGNSVTLTSAFASHYLWDTGDTTRSISVNASAPHQCVVTGYSGCVASTNSINVTSKPTLFSVTGGGTICQSSNGIAIGLSSSEIGVSYQLKLNGVNSGLAVSGNSNAISFGLRNQAGTYTVFATEISSACTATMNGSADIVVNHSPTNFSLTGGGNFCSGSSGVNIGLSGSETGIIYALQLNGVPTGNSPSGTGSALSFGNVNQSGTYTVFATNISTTCAATLAGNIVVTQISSPQIFTVTGGGSYCPGQTGPSIGLSSSQNAVTYQLYDQNGIVGSGISGTGSSLSFGSQTGPATFYIIATASNGCSSQMSGTVSSTPLPEPSLFSVSGGGTFCPQDVAGTTVGLSHSESGVNYSLLLGGLPTGNTVSGDGILPVDFGLQSSPGIYTVIATKISDGCTLIMNGNATVAALPVLNWYADADNDGYGNAASVVQSCSQPSGYISDASDCNDQNADINPGAVEICGNNIDDNCDGQTDEGCGTTLSLHLYLQGFYTGSGLMRAVASPLSAPSVCDTITVELAAATGLHQVVYSSTAVLNVNGSTSLVFPPSVSGQSLYIVIRHRNSIRTWSASPYPFSVNANQYDFTTALSSAFGNNQFVENDGAITLLTGDINQDGFSTLTDFSLLESVLTDFQNQYRPEDINGDGLVESEDYSLLENAIMNGHHEIHP
ncbi:MAG: MopE-related protein [Bacteroidia bacterium]